MKKPEKTSIRQRKFVKGTLAGKSARQAALDAGYAETTANRATVQIAVKPAVQTLLKDVLVKTGLTSAKIAQRLKEGVDAKETKFFAKDGRVTDERTVIDLGMRHQYLQTVMKITGDLIDRHEITGQLSVAEILAASTEGPADE